MQIQIVKPGHELITPIKQIMGYPRQIERAGRTCYKSEDKITDDSAGKFIRMLIKSGHHSVLEHCSITVKIICDRACSHQLVRHRIAAYSQESQRYCDYSKGNTKILSVICPPTIGQTLPGIYQYNSEIGALGGWVHESNQVMICATDSPKPKGEANTLFEWISAISDAHYFYETMRRHGVPPEDARSVLPNAAKTEVVTTFNLRQWRHVFAHRALNKRAQWQIREIMLGILDSFTMLLPDVFGDLKEKENAA